jgi:hypothetical protein
MSRPKSFFRPVSNSFDQIEADGDKEDGQKGSR